MLIQYELRRPAYSSRRPLVPVLLYQHSAPSTSWTSYALDLGGVRGRFHIECIKYQSDHPQSKAHQEIFGNSLKNFDYQIPFDSSYYDQNQFNYQHGTLIKSLTL